MKIDFANWHEVNLNETYESPPGRLWLRATSEVACIATAEGVEVLAGTGTQIDVRNTTEQVTFVVTSKDETARVWIYSPVHLVHVPAGETFANADRRPQESGTVMAIRAAKREFEFAQRRAMREMRLERQKIEQERRKARPLAPSQDDDSQIEEQDADTSGEGSEQ